MATSDPPAAIDRYLREAAGGDLDALLGCFTPDATVIDEDKTFRGHDEIRRWRETVTSKFTYTLTVLSKEAVGADQYTVTVRLDGNFPANSVQLRFRFALRGGLISELEIAP
jgi:ketosteroid isomerase-like protein